MGYAASLLHLPQLMALVQVGKIRPTVAEQITLESIPKVLERLDFAKVGGNAEEVI
jgi:D-arabinose 1-dehydrogenase-like Zn-dependent alcohol dehydrogenase